MSADTKQRSPHDECPTCGGCIDAPRVGWSGCWHTPGDDCLLNYCHPCRDECHQCGELLPVVRYSLKHRS